jgi:hypothetical protein
VGKVGNVSLSQLREQYGTFISLVLDVNFALWTFCAFASAASALNAAHTFPVTKTTFTLYNYCNTLATNQVPKGCTSTPSRTAAGVVTISIFKDPERSYTAQAQTGSPFAFQAFSFFLWLQLMASAYLSHKNRGGGGFSQIGSGGQGNSDLSTGLSSSEMSQGLGQVPSSGNAVPFPLFLTLAPPTRAITHHAKQLLNQAHLDLRLHSWPSYL